MERLNIVLAVAVSVCFLVIAASANPYAVISSTEGTTLPEIINFQVSPTSIDSGSTATLAWDVNNASEVEIDHGIGIVSGSGRVNVNPPYSTTYRLSVSNGAGVRRRYVTLYVDRARPHGSDEVNCDPVTGRNSQVDMAWESYCLSDEYQVQIARDPGFTLVMYDSGSMRTADSMLPAFWYPPGNLEAGHTYYWRVRTTRAATGQHLLRYWSDIKSFTVTPGYAVRTNYSAVQAFVPANGCAACPVKSVSFSWAGYPDTTKYRFMLARDSQLQNIVVEGFTSTTSYALTDALDYDTSYFWQVMQLEPVPSDTSPVFTFHTESASAPRTKQPPAAALPLQAPPWAIAAISIGIVLIIAVTVFAVRSRKIW